MPFQPILPDPSQSSEACLLPLPDGWMSDCLRIFPQVAGQLQLVSERLQAVGHHETATWQQLIEQIVCANFEVAVLEAFLDLSFVWPPWASFPALIRLGQAAIQIGRCGGSFMAAKLLRQWQRSLHQQRAWTDIEGYCQGLERLAEADVQALALVLEAMPDLMAKAEAQGFFAWVYAGLRACGHNRAQSLAFFGLRDNFSQQLLEQDLSRNDLTMLERRLRGGLLALWGEQRQVSSLRRAPSQSRIPLRVSLAGGVLRFPVRFPGHEGTDAALIYRAAAAHAGAHYRYSTVKFPALRLKPLQIALVSLIEDARVEALAIRQYPGLFSLWRHFYGWSDQNKPGPTSAGLMLRLSRALLDPAYVDEDGWVTKGRQLFGKAQGHWDDPAISREIGGLLGNDLGQMRVQFNPKTYVVQPDYRDNNLALWDFGNQPDSPQETIELELESIGVRRKEGAAAGEDDASAAKKETTRPRVALTESAIEDRIIATYPEWDYQLGIERPDWVSIRHRPPHVATGPISVGDDVEARIGRIIRAVPVGQRVRRKRISEGDIMDVDAAIEAVLSRRMKKQPDDRIFQSFVPGPRDLAALLLLDLSQSTSDADAAGRRVLELEREAALAIGRAMSAAGDRLAIDGFCSDGRSKVYYTPLKDASEPFDIRVMGRLAGTVSGYSTRLGAALRHAGSRLERMRGFRRVLILLTDGEPSDVDVPDRRYLQEDARFVVQGFKRRGLDAFALGIGEKAASALVDIFGGKRTLHVAKAAKLPEQLLRLYEELKK